MALITWRNEDNTTKNSLSTFFYDGLPVGPLTEILDVPDGHIMFLNGKQIEPDDKTKVKGNDEIIIQPRSSVEF